MDKILDDYFYGVCYEFYKRQMQIWILLSHKYLRSSSVGIVDRRFLYQDIGLGSNQGTTLTSGAGEPDVEPQAEEKKQGVAKMPFFFTASESKDILDMTESINHKLDSLFRGTVDSPAVGNLAENLSLPQTPPMSPKGQVAPKLSKKEKPSKVAKEENDDEEEEKKEPKAKVNHYKELGLEETGIVRKIAGVVGFAQLTKKSKKEGASKSNTKSSKAKSGTAKKKTG